jgi:hypothetical protein
MKIGKERIAGLTQKNTAGGLRYYWEPAPAQRKAGWKTITLSNELADAIAAAKKRNDDIANWKEGGARPTAIKRYVKKATFGHVLQRYRKEKMSKLGAETQKVDKYAIDKLEQWAGDQAISYITRARVRALRDAMCPGGPGTPGHHPAYTALKKGRAIFAWAMAEMEDVVTSNPFENFGLPAPDPRQAVWEPDDVEAFCAMADEMELHSIGLAVRIGTYTGQREGDILKLTTADWREVTLRQLRFDKELHAQLASATGPDAGKVMGVRILQSKGKRWIGTPIEGELRDEMEAAIAAAKQRNAGKDIADIAAARILIKEANGKPWEQKDFIRTVKTVRDAAIARAKKQGDQARAIRLDTLQFRDLRRTCVVTLGELGLDDAAISAITGHTLATIKKILETYMPRTEAMAARAIVARIGPRPKKDGAGEKEQSA